MLPSLFGGGMHGGCGWSGSPAPGPAGVEALPPSSKMVQPDTARIHCIGEGMANGLASAETANVTLLCC